MIYLWLSPLVMASAIAFYVALHVIEGGISVAEGFGLALGSIAGIAVLALVARRVKTFLQGNDNEKVGSVLAANLMVKLLGLFSVAGIVFGIRSSNGALGLETPDPMAALGCYIACIFLGYAWQAKLVQGRHHKQRPSVSETGAATDKGR